MVKAVFEGYYNPRGIIFGPVRKIEGPTTSITASNTIDSDIESIPLNVVDDEAVPPASPQIAAFYGWLVQFQLKNESFDLDFGAALRDLNLPQSDLGDIVSAKSPDEKTPTIKNLGAIIPQSWKSPSLLNSKAFSFVPGNSKSTRENEWPDKLQKLPSIFQRLMISTVVLIGLITMFVVFVSPKVNASITKLSTMEKIEK